MEDQMLYEPRELFQKQLKDNYHKAAEEYFDSLTKDSKVDTAANEEHVKQYKKDKENADALEKEASSARGLKIFVLVMLILCFVAGVISIVVGVLGGAWYFYLIGGFLIAGGIALIVVISTIVKKMVAKREEAAAKAKQKAQQSLDVCKSDMGPLNASFDWNAPCVIMEKATPIIDLDPYFSPEKFCYLRDKFGVGEIDDPHQTVLGVISGQIQGNPFIVEKILTEETKDKNYTGSITIHWTTTYHDKNGTHTQHHTQTLYATITRPAPFYRTDTRLIYGNEAAPHLHFSRGPSGVSNMSDGDRDKQAAAGMKKLRKLSEKQLSSGSEHVITPMGNDHFDVFFGADDRDNEVEFRLLFTPLAQKNMLNIIENPQPYGDDFVMVKDGMVNSIASGHSQSFDYSANPEGFCGYDWKEMKSRFVSYCDAYIQSLYFDLAPLLSIPLYQMHKPHEYIYDGSYGSNLTSYEHEVMANGMSPSLFKPKDAGDDLPLIIKQKSSSKVGNTDQVLLSAYSFKETPMVEHVSKMGGDGRLHDIPVPWIKYDLVTKDSSIGVRHVGSNRKEFNQKRSGGKTVLSNLGSYYQRGLFSFMWDENGQSADKALGSLFSTEKTGDNMEANSKEELNNGK